MLLEELRSSRRETRCAPPAYLALAWFRIWHDETKYCLQIRAQASVILACLDTHLGPGSQSSSAADFEVIADTSQDFKVMHSMKMEYTR
jgi:hypothetical protein